MAKATTTSATTAKPLTEDQVKQFVQAISSADWNLNFVAYCQFMGIEQDEYSIRQFQGLQNLSKALNLFDNANLTKLANYKKETIEPKEDTTQTTTETTTEPNANETK